MKYIKIMITKQMNHLRNQGGLHNAHTNGALGLPPCKPFSFHFISQQTTKKKKQTLGPSLFPFDTLPFYTKQNRFASFFPFLLTIWLALLLLSANLLKQDKLFLFSFSLGHLRANLTLFFLLLRTPQKNPPFCPPLMAFYSHYLRSFLGYQ